MHKGKKFKNVTRWIFLSITQKESLFFKNFLDVIFFEYFKCQTTWFIL